MRNDLDELKKSQKKEGHCIVLALLNSSKETNMQRSLPSMRHTSLVLHQANGGITSCPSAKSQMTIPGVYPNIPLWRAVKSKGLGIGPWSYHHLLNTFCSFLFISPLLPAEWGITLVTWNKEAVFAYWAVHKCINYLLCCFKLSSEEYWDKHYSPITEKIEIIMPPQFLSFWWGELGFESTWVKLWNSCSFRYFSIRVWSIGITHSLYILYSGLGKEGGSWWYLSRTGAGNG